MTLKLSNPIKLGLVLALVSSAAACTSTGFTNNPLERKLSWFSYMEGGDIRAACGPATPNRYRLVYNGVYNEQVRTYELIAERHLNVGVIEAVDLTQFGEGIGGILAPWQAKMVGRDLDQEQSRALVNALAVDGAFGPPAVDTELSSRGFFWTIAACHQGAYHFTALAWPSQAWDDATFDDVLFALDPSPIAVNPPRKTLLDRINTGGPKNVESIFNTKVGENGLAGFQPLF
ncbi:hypothetical protein [Magnetovibrio blakemorei]|uniref:hypothetical protein n=1 Tax=Magnetovibrio blakemorei TaxID=28181 RepID=UPI001112F648|nr:hypothetical protein [Magnetovibrio blakemorei]